MTIDFDAEMRRLDSLSPAERRRELERGLSRMAQDRRASKAPRLHPTKGHRGAHKLFRGGKR